MKSGATVIAILVVATMFGLVSKSNRGRFRVKKNFHPILSRAQIGADLGSVATVLQFSSAFCAPCRATRQILENLTPQFPGIAHIEIDAESHLELVRRLKVHQTPTTLFLNANGQEIGRAVGAPKKSQLFAVLEKLHGAAHVH